MHRSLLTCIHGHFYQPPRENPWLEEIELQDSAAPFHDWNERIHFECYHPNSRARVLDSHGLILDIVNNYEMISFNFGPTLLSWLENKHPETYQAILAADRKSVENRNGHGNAIAQVYNHMIMPLANRRDKVTQVKWGIAEFVHRFRRKPESIWLSETACNEETLEVLVDEGIRYIILAPQQAEAVRDLTGDTWNDVSNESINPKAAYRCFLKKDPSRFIDVIFYDGPISRACAFEDILFDAKRWMDRMESAVGNDTVDQLISVATDGETFGHHKAFGDRVVAYMLNVEVPKRRHRVLNFGQFLDEQPPRFAVKIKTGENGEGTSWSCPHGVSRWKDHCGCRGDGPGEWTQLWRKPLREALDFLRDELALLYESNASQYLKDVWASRDAYIEVVLDRSGNNIKQFFEKHAKHPLLHGDNVTCLKWLELQRNAMLMYTSCGWFFTELSGLETTQILQYAARAIEYAKELTGTDLEEEFLARLAHAKSNVAQFKDGRGVYDQLVKPKRFNAYHMVSFFAIQSLILQDDKHQNPVLYCYNIQVEHERHEFFAKTALNMGQLRIKSEITKEEQSFFYAAVRVGPSDFRCSVKLAGKHDQYLDIEKQLIAGLSNANTADVLEKIDRLFGGHHYTLKDFPAEPRMKIMSFLMKDALQKIEDVYDELYDENRSVADVYRIHSLPVPNEMIFAIQHTLSRRIRDSLTELLQVPLDQKLIRKLYKLTDLGQRFRIELNKKELGDLMGSALNLTVAKLEQAISDGPIADALSMIKIAKHLDIEPSYQLSQDRMLQLLRSYQEKPLKFQAATPELVAALLKLAQNFQINLRDFKQLKEYARTSEVH